jgi:DNA-directed RNA polymerase specialized sigma subunit
VTNYLQKTKRWIGANQNIGRIPENRLYQISNYQRAVNELQDEHGEIPDDQEVSKRLGWSLSEVVRMRQELRKDLDADAFEGDMLSHVPSKTEATLRLFEYELEGKERLLYQYLTGYGKPQVTSTTELSELLGEEPYAISRMKAKIADRLKAHLTDTE